MRARRVTSLALAAALAAAVALSGCGGGKPSAASVLSQTVAETGKVRSFHIVVTVANPPRSTKGLSLTYAEGDLVVPGRFRDDVTGTFFGVPLSTKLVVIGRDTYLRSPLGGGWQKVSVKLTPLLFFEWESGVLAIIARMTGLELLGEEDLGGVRVYHLRGTVPASAISPLLGNPRSSRPVRTDVWTGKSDLRLRRVELSGPLASAEPANVARIVDVSRYDQPVEIVAPQVGG